MAFLFNFTLWLIAISYCIECIYIGYPNCDNSLLHGTAPVAGNWAAGPAWNGAHSYAYQSAPAYNQYDDGSYHPEYHQAYNDYTTNDIHGPGGDKYEIITTDIIFWFKMP